MLSNSSQLGFNASTDVLQRLDKSGIICKEIRSSGIAVAESVVYLVSKFMDYNCKLLALKQVTNRVSLSKSSIYRKMESGTFPKPVSLGGKTVRWLVVDIVDIDGCTVDDIEDGDVDDEGRVIKDQGSGFKFAISGYLRNKGRSNYEIEKLLRSKHIFPLKH